MRLTWRGRPATIRCCPAGDVKPLLPIRGKGDDVGESPRHGLGCSRRRALRLTRRRRIFFKGVATEGRLRALYDFENRRTRYKEKSFFPDVDMRRFKFCAFVASSSPSGRTGQVCVFICINVFRTRRFPSVAFPLTAQDFALVNPNTGTAPIFRSRQDAELDDGDLLREDAGVWWIARRATEGEAWPVAIFYHVFT